MSLAEKLFGSFSDRELKKINPLTKQVLALEGKYQAMSDAELQAQTPALKQQLADGKTLDNILPDAFAVCREAAWRVLGMKHFPVQVTGGIALHRGDIAEMQTGEGKTLVATLPAYLNALTGEGVHIVTVNDYLAKRDSEWMGKLYRWLGPRTAGFNTVELTDLSEAGQFITIALMLIGGSPGSTAGGLKTTTIAVLLTTAISTFRRRENANLFGRRIDDDVVKNAATISLMYITLCCTGGLIISVSEGLPMLTCLFETASAVGTVGLSLGITPELNLLSRSVLILLMFFGRVGGLTLIFAALSSAQKKVSKLPKEKITVG